MASKRTAQSASSDGKPRKKPKLSTAASLETRSIEERVQPFRIMTVKFPIDYTTPNWSTGQNRDVNEKHVKQLCHLFEEYGLERLNCAHRICLLSSLQDVQRACKHLGINCVPNDPTASPPYFESWGETCTGPVEVLAGNHRIAALKMYLERRKLDGNRAERWWLCDIYDRGM